MFAVESRDIHVIPTVSYNIYLSNLIIKFIFILMHVNALVYFDFMNYIFKNINTTSSCSGA